MGCHSYTVLAPQSWSSDRPEEPMYKEVYLAFHEDDPVQCLCTFPHNYRENPDFVPVYSLALLGAAVVLAHQNHLEHETIHYLPSDLPQWIVDGIRKKVLPEELPTENTENIDEEKRDES